jgi:hypothetical protein
MAKKKNAAAVQLGKRGAKARMDKMTPEQRAAVAKNATARWGLSKVQDAPAKDTGDKLEPKKPAKKRK